MSLTGISPRLAEAEDLASSQEGKGHLGSEASSL